MRNYRLSPEQQLHAQVADYLKLQYPRVLWRSDMAGVRLTPLQASKAKRVQHSRAFPDLFIYEAKQGKYGLALELKRDGTTIYLKNGNLTANPHIREQAAVLDQLREAGYAAEFGVGFDQCKQIIDRYLTDDLLTN